MAKYARKLAPLDPCPVEHVVALVGGKWKARILFRLAQGPSTLGDLGRALPRVRSQVLSGQLQQLAADGLVVRLEPAEPRMWGAFALTPRGHGLNAVLDAVALWGIDDLGGWAPPARNSQEDSVRSEPLA